MTSPDPQGPLLTSHVPPTASERISRYRPCATKFSLISTGDSTGLPLSNAGW